MEKIKNVALIVLVIMVLWLFIDRYAIQNSAATNDAADKKTEIAAPEGALKIAYINIDSVLLSYDQSLAMNTDFTAKRQKSEDEFAKKAKVFEKEYLAFQEKAQRGGFLSQASMEVQQRSLMKQKEELEGLESRLTNELMTEQQRLNEILYKTIVDYVRRYNQTAGYDLILTNTGMGTIMQGHPGLNITPAVVDGLNAEYKLKK
jgi:outer membrane protein